MTQDLFLKELANQIKIARKLSGKSQLEVVDITGINVARIEKGEASIQLYTYYRLCKYFNINFEEMLNQIDKKMHLLTPTSLHGI